MEWLNQGDLGIDHEEEVGRMFICEICTRQYKHQVSLNKHLKTHEGNQYVCQRCDKIFSSECLLKQHLQRTHAVKKEHLCSDCGAVYRSQLALSNHARFKHQHKGTSCLTCGKSFKDKYALNRHKESHTQSKKECPSCKQMFRDVSKHEQNCKVKTKKVRQYDCDACNKKFLCKRYLRNHLKHKHKSPEEYRCSCGKAYSYARSLKRHQKLCKLGIAT